MIKQAHAPLLIHTEGWYYYQLGAYYNTHFPRPRIKRAYSTCLSSSRRV